MEKKNSKVNVLKKKRREKKRRTNDLKGRMNEFNVPNECRFVWIIIQEVILIVSSEYNKRGMLCDKKEWMNDNENKREEGRKSRITEMKRVYDHYL